MCCHKRRNMRRAFIEQQMMAQHSGMMGPGVVVVQQAPMCGHRRRGPIAGLIALATRPLMTNQNQNQNQYQPQYQQQFQGQPQYQQAAMQSQQYGVAPVYRDAPQYQSRDLALTGAPVEQTRQFVEKEQYIDEKEVPLEFSRSREDLPAYEAEQRQRMSLADRPRN